MARHNRLQVLAARREGEQGVTVGPKLCRNLTLVAAGLLFAGIALNLLVTRESGLQAGGPNAADETSVRDLEDQLSKAIVQGDVAAFERLFADDFTHTSQDGSFRTRAQWLKGRVPGKSNYISYGVDDLQIRIYGETAVVTGLAKPSWRESDGSLASGRFRFLRVWVNRGDRWQAVAFQSTRSGEKKE